MTSAIATLNADILNLDTADIQYTPGDYWFDNCKLVGEIWFYTEESVIDWDRKSIIKDWLWDHKSDPHLMGKAKVVLEAVAKAVGLQDKKDNFMH
jgi:hypothetical protein